MVVSLYLGVGLDLKPIIAEMTLHAETEDGCRVVVANLFLLGIVPYACHASVQWAV